MNNKKSIFELGYAEISTINSAQPSMTNELHNRLCTVFPDFKQACEVVIHDNIHLLGFYVASFNTSGSRNIATFTPYYYIWRDGYFHQTELTGYDMKRMEADLGENVVKLFWMNSFPYMLASEATIIHGNLPNVIDGYDFPINVDVKQGF